MDTGAEAELPARELSYKPLFMVSSWIQRSRLTKRLCVAIMFLYGAGSGDFTSTVVYGVQFLQLALRTSKPLVHELVMHL